MTNERTTHILARLERGFRTDAALLKVLEQDLAVTLQSARRFGERPGSPGDWDADWHSQWDAVEGILRRIGALVAEMDGSIESNDSTRLQRGLEAWETIQSEDAKLVVALGSLRVQAGNLKAAVRDEWNLLARTLASHLETLQACAHAFRIKLELLKKHSKGEVDQAVLEILARLPNRPRTDGPEAEEHQLEYRKAATELAEEHHKCLGFMDVVKGLLLWVETTPERADKNLSLEVDPA